MPVADENRVEFGYVTLLAALRGAIATLNEVGDDELCPDT
jgi:hypothetical protein